MNKIIKADDIDFIGVEIGALIKKCPDMTSDMLYALLSLRGDISKSDYKDVSRINQFMIKMKKCNFYDSIKKKIEIRRLYNFN
jgi:hypothetical protein